jgi:CHAT domain-containing protein
MKNVIPRLFGRGRRKNSETAEGPLKATPDGGESVGAEKPPPPGAQDNLTLESYRPLARSQGPDKLIEVIAKTMPDFAAIMQAGAFDAKVKILRSLAPADQQRMHGHLVAIGFHLQKVGRLKEALELQKLLLELVRLRPETDASCFMGNTQPRNMADVLEAIGEVYAEMGELGLALQTLLEAETWYEKDSQLRMQKGIVGESEYDRLFVRTDVRASLCAHTSGVYRKLGDAEKAQEYDRKAWKYAGEKKTGEQRLEFLFGEGNGLRKAGEYDRALHVLNEALELALTLSESTVVSRDVSRVCVALGDAYSDLKLYRRALEFYKRSYELNRSSMHHGRMIQDCTKLGAVYEATGKSMDAIRSYEEALRWCSVEYQPTRISERSLNLWEYQGSRYLIVRKDEAWGILHRLGKIGKAKQDPRAMEYLELAIRVIESLRVRILAEGQRIGFQTTVIDVYETMIELQLELWQRENNPARLEALFSYIERAKSRVLIEQLADLPVLQPKSVTRSLFDEENELTREIEELERRLIEGTGNAVDLSGQLIAAQEAISRVWANIENEDPYAGAEYVSLRRASPTSADDIRQIVSQGGHATAVVEYYATARNLLILVLFSDKSEIACRVINTTRELLRDLALVNPASPPSLDLRMPYWQLDLAPLLVEPVSGLVKEYERICFVPHDVLHSIPLHALHLGKTDKRTLTEVADIFFVPSASLLKYCRNKPPRNRGNNLVLGNPKRDDQTSIPLTMEEARTIAKALGCSPFVEEQATKSLLFMQSGKAEYIHIACHGEFRKDAGTSSALLLSDGNLTAEEMLGLQLRSELVVLSACETGISETRSGDELIGFVRALLYAGTPSVVLSLWNAYDESTSKLMISFYDKILHQGLPKAKALSLAQRDLIKSGYAEATWAPFILVGDWE